MGSGAGGPNLLRGDSLWQASVPEGAGRSRKSFPRVFPDGQPLPIRQTTRNWSVFSSSFVPSLWVHSWYSIPRCSTLGSPASAWPRSHLKGVSQPPRSGVLQGEDVGRSLGRGEGIQQIAVLVVQLQLGRGGRRPGQRASQCRDGSGPGPKAPVPASPPASPSPGGRPGARTGGSSALEGADEGPPLHPDPRVGHPSGMTSEGGEIKTGGRSAGEGRRTGRSMNLKSPDRYDPGRPSTPIPPGLRRGSP